jgi:hypothetical protein
LAVKLWEELRLDRFWAKRLAASRKGTRRDQVLLVLTTHRLIAPGAEWRLHKPWYQARPGVQVKLLPQDGELYVFAQSADRVAKERAMRQRQLKRLWTRLKQVSAMRLSREKLS